MKTTELGKALRRVVGSKKLWRPPQPPPAPEALLDLRIEHLQKQFDEVKGRVNALLLIILGAVITDLVIRLLA